MIINEQDVILKAGSTQIDPDIYQLTTDRKGMPNVLYTGNGLKRYIHSNYDAVKDGQNFAANNYNEENIIAVFGMGLGYHIKALAAMLKPNQRLYVFETNLSLLKLALENTDILDFLQNENILFCASDSPKDLSKYFFSSLFQITAFILYKPAISTVPETFYMIKQYLGIHELHTCFVKEPGSLADVIKNFDYIPIKRCNKYNTVIIGYPVSGTVFQSFIDSLVPAFEYLGCDVEYIAYEDFLKILDSPEDLPIPESFAICDFFVCCDNTYVGELYDDLRKPVISVGIDRPYALSSYIRNEVNHAIYTWSDKSDLKYANLYYRHGTHHFLAHGAEINFDPGNVFKRDRILDVVVSCSYHTDKVFEKLGQSYYNIDTGLIDKVTLHYENSNMLLEDCVKEVVGEACDDEFLYQFMHDVGFAIDVTVRLKNRYRIIKALLDNGIKIHLFGPGWALTDIANHPNCTYHGAVSCEPGREIFERCKILVNNLPAYAGNGAHERVFSSMIRGALCISNVTDYLRSSFNEDNEIVFYKNDDTDGLVAKIKYYLEHEDERLRITKNAFENVRANHTWISRAEEMLTMYEGFMARSRPEGD